MENHFFRTYKLTFYSIHGFLSLIVWISMLPSSKVLYLPCQSQEGNDLLSIYWTIKDSLLSRHFSLFWLSPFTNRFSISNEVFFYLIKKRQVKFLKDVDEKARCLRSFLRSEVEYFKPQLRQLRVKFKNEKKLGYQLLK